MLSLSWVSSPKIRFTLQLKLVLSFALLCGLFLLLSQTAQKAFVSNSHSVEKVLTINRAVKLADEGKINLAKAGQLPTMVEVSTSALEGKASQSAELRDQFLKLGKELAGQVSGAQEQQLTKNFTTIGIEFYDALDALIPIRQKMLSYTADYQGRNRPLPDIITERELGHIHFIHTIKESIEQQKRLTGGLDTAGCTFYQWYSQIKFDDEDIAEVFEEIHPLHDKLHQYAHQIDEKIAAGDLDGARETFGAAEKDLKTLGLYFSGLRKLVDEKFREEEDKFEKQKKAIDEIYSRAEGAATLLQRHLNDTVLKASLADMESVTAGSKQRMFVIAAIGLGISVLIGLYATYMMRASIKVLRQMVTRLNESATLFIEMAEQLFSNSSKTQELAESANRNMEQTSENISSLAASSEEINAAIYEISSSSLLSAGIAKDATDESKRASLVVETLRKQADSINDVSKTISGIAFQTKLLALNANVEAARAGEAGAGFAIVADEVKNLAQSAATAADDINLKIATIQSESKKTAEVMVNIGEIIAKISDNSANIAASVEEESAVVGEISSRINGVAGLAQEATQHIQEVSAAANDTKEQSHSLQDQAGLLAAAAEELNVLLLKL